MELFIFGRCKKINPLFIIFQNLTSRQDKNAIMGQNSSIPELDGFTPEEVQRLGKRFRKLDQDGSGSISINEFVSIPELKENPLTKRLAEVFDSNGDGEVDFKVRICRTLLVWLSPRFFFLFPENF